MLRSHAFVERAALRHVVGHIGDVDREPVIAVGQPIDRNRVVEVRACSPSIVTVCQARKSVRPSRSRAFT